MNIGAHLSISKGFPRALQTARDLGLDCFQYFTRNPRGGAARELPEAEVQEFRARREEAGFGPVAGHLPYTVNLAATDPRQRDFVKLVLREDFRRARILGADFLISHPGRYRDDPLEGARNLAVNFEESGVMGEPFPFLLEVMAGQKGELGADLRVLSGIISALGDPPWVGVCLDSAHLFGGGWDVRTRSGLDSLQREIEATVGLERVKAFHLNDSKVELGSRRDRHANIGEGTIGLEGIRAIVNHPFFGQLPLILETPVDDYSQYRDQADLVRSLV